MNERLDPDEYPLLAALLAYDSTGALLEELDRLGRALRHRHPRRPTQAVARLRAGALERSVVLSDISRSGVSFVLPILAGELTIEDLLAPTLSLRVGDRVLEVRLGFVRLIARRETALHAGFRFEGLSDADADAFDQLGSLFVSDLFRPPPEGASSPLDDN